MKKIIPKVGDVWKAIAAGEISSAYPQKILSIDKNDQVIFWYRRDLNYPDIVMMSIKNFIITNKLVERDGKAFDHPREFRSGYFYPVTFPDEELREVTISQCIGINRFITIGYENVYQQSDFSWIGEELNIAWPKQ